MADAPQLCRYRHRKLRRKGRHLDVSGTVAGVPILHPDRPPKLQRLVRICSPANERQSLLLLPVPMAALPLWRLSPQGPCPRPMTMMMVQVSRCPPLMLKRRIGQIVRIAIGKFVRERCTLIHHDAHPTVGTRIKFGGPKKR